MTDPIVGVRITWFSVANCLMEYEGGAVLIDGYVSRLPRTVFGDDTEATTSVGPQISDPAAVRHAFESLGEPEVGVILTSHAHFDHTWDTAEWAKLTGATVVGTETVAQQCISQGVERSQIRVVEGGEQLDLPGGVRCHVVRGNHGGNDGHRALGRQPRTLTSPPVRDDRTGGLRPGVHEDFPNGGGSLSYLFVDDRQEPHRSWGHTASLSSFDFDEDVVVDGVNCGSPANNLAAGMQAAGLTGVDLWLGPAAHTAHEVAKAILSPRSVVPMHWDDLFLPPDEDDTVYDLEALRDIYGGDVDVRLPVHSEAFTLP